MAEVENKFIVINVKDLKYLTEEYREKLFVITKAIEYGRQDEGKKINDYWVCNQDEPYADQIKSIILTGETKKVIPLEPPVSQENGGHLFNNQKENKMKNTPVDDTFIYKIVLQDTVVDEQKEERFVLARDFNDAVQLACEMCEANDYVVIQTTEIGYVDYCTSKIAEYFSRFSG